MLRREKRMSKRTQDIQRQEGIGNTLFLSLLLLNRRPNLGLIRPMTAFHLREKGT